MKNEPLVSIIMNCYNGEKYLEESLKSIINQSYQNWELIFWDNLSEDNSKKIFEKYKDKRFKYFISDKHSILYHARNLDIQKASGEYISFLDTDDIWLEDKLDKQIKLFSDDSIGLVYGNYWRYNESGFFKKKKLASKKLLPFGKITDTLLKEYSIGILTVVIKKQLIKNKKTIFDTNFDMLSDMDFILKFSKDHKFDCVQDPVAIYRQHENQLQNKNIDLQADQMSEWYEKIKLSKEFGSSEKLLTIRNKCNFLKIVKYINQKLYLKSLKENIFYPEIRGKIKLFLMLLTSKKIFNKLINLR